MFSALSACFAVFSEISVRRDGAPFQVRVEEILHPVPGVAQHVLPRKVVELAGIGHERDEIALSFLQQLINQPDGMEIRHIDVRRAVQDEQRAREPIDVRQG